MRNTSQSNCGEGRALRDGGVWRWSGWPKVGYSFHNERGSVWIPKQRKYLLEGSLCAVHTHTSLKPVGLMSLSRGEMGAINLPFCFPGSKANIKTIFGEETQMPLPAIQPPTSASSFATCFALSETTKEKKKEKKTKNSIDRPDCLLSLSFPSIHLSSLPPPSVAPIPLSLSLSEFYHFRLGSEDLSLRQKRAFFFCSKGLTMKPIVVHSSSGSSRSPLSPTKANRAMSHQSCTAST